MVSFRTVKLTENDNEKETKWNHSFGIKSQLNNKKRNYVDSNLSFQKDFSENFIHIEPDTKNKAYCNKNCLEKSITCDVMCEILSVPALAWFRWELTSVCT